VRKRLIWQVAIGPQRPLWEKCLASVATYAERHGIDYHLQREPILRIAPKQSHRSAAALKLGYLPNLEKLAGLDRLGEYDQVALFDADVWARPDAPDIFEDVVRQADYAACVEREMPIIPAYARKLDAYARGQYGEARFPFFNCGVEVFSASIQRHLHGQTAAQFLARPEFVDFIAGKGAWRWASEQTLMNVWLHACGATLQHLSWRWNGLYGMIDAQRLNEAHLVHFLLSSHLHGDDPETLLRTHGRTRI